MGWALTLSSVNQAAPVNPTGIFALTIIVIVSSGEIIWESGRMR